MKIKRVLVPTITLIIVSSLLFGTTACSRQESLNMIQQTEQIELEYAVPEYDTLETSKVALLPWLALGELESHPELRQAFDNLFQVTGEAGNKVGPIYYNTDTEQADQNVTLFMVLKNTSTRSYFMLDETRDAIGKIAFDNYTDVDDASAIYATINAYFSLLPDQTEGEFDGGDYISRAQAMSILMRAVTQVTDDEKPAENKDFTSAVGDSKYTDFAAPMDAYAYMHTGISGDVGESALDEKTFTTSMNRGEYIYMVTNYLVADYQATLKEKGYVDSYADVEVNLSTIKDAGDITIKEAMANPLQGVPTDMYKTFETAVKYGFITEDDLQNWDYSITKKDAIEIFTSMALSYTTDTAFGLENSGYQSQEQLSEEERIRQENISLTEFAKTLPGDENPNRKLHNWAVEQGADKMLGWCLVYYNGKAAGENPTYAKYVNPDSPDYGKIFYVGDIMPHGARLDGTREEEFALVADEVIKEAEEEGKIYIDPETGKKYIVVGDMPGDGGN